MGADIKSSFAPGIHKYVDNLLRHGKIGTYAGTLRLLEVNTGSSKKIVIGESQSNVADLPNCDRFKIIIPYGGQSVTWEVIFNCHQPEDPPDFVFGPDDQDFMPDIENLRSLCNWNPKDPNVLSNIIQELIEEYRLYQKSLLDAASMLAYEYKVLIEKVKCQEKDTEVFVSKRGNRSGPVSFLIKLPVDFSKIPFFLTDTNFGEDAAVLVVTYASTEGGKVSPQLFISPRVEKALGVSGGLKIPPFPAQGSLEDYVPLIMEILEKQIQHIVSGLKRKEEYISAFLTLYGKSVLEYDVEGFSKICFLMEWHDFFFQVTVDLPVTFPAEKPDITLLSIYHLDKGGGQFSKKYDSYPYSPRWEAIEMAHRAKAFIINEIGDFQKSSVREGAISSE